MARNTNNWTTNEDKETGWIEMKKKRDRKESHDQTKEIKVFDK